MNHDLLRQAWERADGARWGLSVEELGTALGRSLDRRFVTGHPSPADERDFVASLHLADLALACACGLGREAAWEHFVLHYRPILLRVAASHSQADTARDVADSLYADLFGLEERNGVRRSLFDYYHGRSSLASWLRAVVAQRLIDRARASRRLEPMPEPGAPGEPAAPADVPDIDRLRVLPVAQRAVRDALASLESGDRLRMSLYYVQGMTLAAIGRTIGESEATVSRKLDRTRRAVRAVVERVLRDEHGLNAAQVMAGLDSVRTDPAFDLARALPPE